MPIKRTLVTKLPPPSPEAASGAAEILKRLLSDSERFLDELPVGVDPDTALRVWDGKQYRYPRFQFGHDGKLLPRFQEFVEVMPRESSHADRNTVLWLYQPDALLDGRSPAEVFPEDPDRLLNLIRWRRGEASE